VFLRDGALGVGPFEDDDLALEVRELAGLAVDVGESEVRRGLAGLDGAGGERGGEGRCEDERFQGERGWAVRGMAAV
jgi:hypothetical protein